MTVKKAFSCEAVPYVVVRRTPIDHRLKWAGIDTLPFEVVTVYEESRFTELHEKITNRVQLFAKK